MVKDSGAEVVVGAGVVVVVVDLVVVGRSVVLVLVVVVLVVVVAEVVVVGNELAPCANARCSAPVNARTTGAAIPAAVAIILRRVARDGNGVFSSPRSCNCASASSATASVTSWPSEALMDAATSASELKCSHASHAAAAVAFNEYTVCVRASQIAIEPSANFATARESEWMRSILMSAGT